MSGRSPRPKGAHCMRLFPPPLRIAILYSFLALLSAYTAVDEYADRALTYNLEAEQAQARHLLLNVVRASLRRPMQFSTIQSVQGTSSAKGSAALTVPFGHRKATPNSLTLNGEVSMGTSNF